LNKRQVALAFLAFLLALAGGTVAVLRTPWAGERICGLAAKAIADATGLDVAFERCTVDPFALEVEAGGVRVGDPARPLFAAELLAARLAPVQAFGGTIHLARVRAVRPRLDAILPERDGDGGACPPDFLSRFDIRALELEDGRVALGLPGGARLEIDRLDVSSGPAARRGLPLARGERRTRIETRVGPARLVLRRAQGDRTVRTWRLERAAITGEVALDLSEAEIVSAEAEGEGLRVALHGTIESLCAPRLDAVATVEATAATLAAIAGRPEADVAGAVFAELRASGPARALGLAGAVHFEDLRLGQYTPGDGRAELRLEPERLAVDRLELRLDSGVVVAKGSVALAPGLPMQGEVTSEGADLAEILHRVSVTDVWSTMKLEGTGTVEGTLAPIALSGAVAMDVRDLRVLDASWRRFEPGDFVVLEVDRGRLESPVRVTEDGLFFDGAQGTVGDATVTLDAGVHFRQKDGFWARGRGEVDLGALGHVAGVPWSGRANVELAIDGAPYGRLRAGGRVRVDRFRYLDLDLGNGAADVSVDQFLLKLSDIQGVKGVSRYRGEVLVDLGRTPSHVVASRFTAQGRIRDLLDAVHDYLPRTRFLRDVVDGDIEVSATASGPATAMDAAWEARAGAGTLQGRRFDSGRAEGRIVRADEVVLERGELRRGSGIAHARGRWGALPPFPWDLEVSLAGLALQDLALPGGGWAGSASGTAVLRGSLERPDVSFALNGDGVAVRGAALGSVQVGGTLRDRLRVTGTAEGVRFSGEAQLEGRMPFRAQAELAAEDLGKLLPGGPPAGLRARVAGEATAEGELLAPEDLRAKIRLDRFALGYADFRVDNAGPVVLEVDRGRIDVRALALRGTNTEFSLTGSRAPSGALDLAAAGTLDLRLLGGLLPAVRRPHGQLVLEAHVGGTAGEPVLVGAGRVIDAGFGLQGATIGLEGIRGALAFSQNRVLFEELSAVVNGGRASLRGEVELANFAPARLRIETRLEEVPIAVPASLPATLSGRVEVSGTPDASTVRGRLRVLRARYTENVDLEKSLLELKRRLPPPPRAYDKAGEWLRFDVQLVVDGDVRVDNDLVRGEVRGDLTVTGSLAAPGLVGTLAMGEGSRAMFRGNEFELSHAIVDFTERHQIAMGVDVHGEAQVREYQVFMHLHGPFDGPQLVLTSSPPLSQPDIITLLSLGFTRRDAAAGAGVGGVATAVAAQALLSSSGLDEQVKRFLPRNGVLRDVSVRVTSVYSENTGQVEPRAEFESWLWRDRLRLRYQAPLSGARGQRAQAEVRLGEHTALQYQWDAQSAADAASTSTGDHGVDLKLRWEWND
jgi:translocation and assembly module TamB